MFYNHFFKTDFLETVENESTKLHYSALFNKSKPLEEQLEKDLYNFTDFEVEVFLYSINTAYKSTLNTYLNQCKSYCDYAIEVGAKTTNVNIFKLFTYSSLDKYLATYRMKYMSLDDFEATMSTVYNPIDFALFYAIFEGIGGFEQSELVNMKKQDVREAVDRPVTFNGDTWYLINLYENAESGLVEREHLISPNLLKALESASNQETYYTNNGNENTRGFNSRPLFETEKVFRNVQVRGDSKPDIDKQLIYRRLRMLNEITDGALSSLSSITNSGVIWYLDELAKEKEVDGKQLRVVGYEEADETLQHFAMSISTASPNTSYKNLLKRHDKALEEVYDVEVEYSFLD